MINRKRTRLLGYDYSVDNLYFVTSIVLNRMCCFGEVLGGKMILNHYGKIAQEQFNWLNDQYPYVKIHESIVMPDHVHVIIEINRGFIGNGLDNTVRNGRDRSLQITTSDRSLQITTSDRSLQITTSDRSLQITPSDGSQPSQKIKSLSELLGAYKTTVSKQIHQIGLADFQWHKSFHDRIIRNEMEYQRIRDYIINNPENWKKEELNQILTS